MKIIYTAPTRDASGYGEASRGYIRSLLLNKHDINVRPIKFDAFKEDNNIDIQALESKETFSADVSIEHLSPDLFGKFTPQGLSTTKRIGVTVHETDSIHSSWVASCNKMDAVITASECNKRAFEQSGVTVPVYVVNHTFNTEKYKRNYAPIELLNNNNSYKFYSIFWHSYKKGLDKLIKGFYLAFQDNEDVCLVLRTYRDPRVVVEDPTFFKEFIEEHKKLIPLVNYPKIHLINHTLTDEEICRLHVTCDTYVTASRGEGWNIPCFDAVGFGKTPIATHWGGMAEYLNEDNSYKVEHEMVPCMGMTNSAIYSPKSRWATPLLSSLIKGFKTAYEGQYRDKLHNNCIQDIEQYSYERCNLSEVLKDILNG
jgi:glycosyltransferase involved in cell wall biosynthesis